MSNLESIVIVKNPHGWVATLRFSNFLDDIAISHNMRFDRMGNPIAHSKTGLYNAIEKYVRLHALNY